MVETTTFIGIYVGESNIIPFFSERCRRGFRNPRHVLILDIGIVLEDKARAVGIHPETRDWQAVAIPGSLTFWQS